MQINNSNITDDERKVMLEQILPYYDSDKLLEYMRLLMHTVPNQTINEMIHILLEPHLEKNKLDLRFEALLALYHNCFSSLGDSLELATFLEFKMVMASFDNVYFARRIVLEYLIEQKKNKMEYTNQKRYSNG